MKKLLASVCSILSVLMLTSLAVNAQTTNETMPAAAQPQTEPTATTATSETEFKQFAQTPFSFSVDTESVTGRKKGEDEISQFNTNIYPMLSYQVAPDSVVSAYTNQYFYRNESDYKKTDYKSYNAYVAAKFHQKNILTEEANGVGFAADVRYYHHASTKSQMVNEADGMLNFRTYLDKKFSDSFSINNHNRFYFVNKSSSYTTDGSATRVLDLRLTPTFHFSEKLTSGVLFQYINNKVATPSSAVAEDTVYVTPNVGYAFSDKFNFLTELEYLALTSSDDKTYANDHLVLIPQASYAFSKQFSAAVITKFPLANAEGKYDSKHLTDNMTVELDLFLVAF